MAQESEPKGSGKIRAITFLIIGGLVLALAFSLYQQTISSAESKVLEAGLIETGDTPTIYFNLKNNDFRYANYTYRVVSNASEELDSGLIINVPPGQIFYYTMVLTRPEKGAITIKLEIYQEEEGKTSAIYSQTWLIKALENT
ncbi:hypothetical protein H5T51_02075 [Candidatus Bathyarchaeota archaeon]|nr:hypothetical protein [Candidatus Bathyarchaeota archaeon]